MPPFLLIPLRGHLIIQLGMARWTRTSGRIAWGIELVPQHLS